MANIVMSHIVMAHIVCSTSKKNAHKTKMWQHLCIDMWVDMCTYICEDVCADIRARQVGADTLADVHKDVLHFSCGL